MLGSLPPRKWDTRCAAHLLNRAGFGGSPDAIRALEQLGMEKAVESLLEGPEEAGFLPKPEQVVYFDRRAERQEMNSLSQEQREMRRKERGRSEHQAMVALIGWWLQRMRQSPWVLREKLTLFWHGHFASGAPKVKEPYLLWQQNQTLRTHALGNFNTLAKAISRDPAMMLYLDTVRSRANTPNENFAREFFELFTIGIGNYSESDVQQSARAFTGYRIDPANGAFRFAPREHDSGPKTIFGKTMNFGGDDVVDLATSKPACARLIGTKLWEFFAFEDPERPLVEAIAAEFRRVKYEIRPLMRTLLRSEEFYSQRTIGTQIKSPVQWLIQTSKVLETDLPQPAASFNGLRQLGQVPFAPPNVKGWDGGKAWITTSTLLLRYNLSSFVLGTGGMAFRNGKGRERLLQKSARVDLQRIAPDAVRTDPKQLVGVLAARLFQHPLPEREREKLESFVAGQPDTGDATVSELLHLMMSTPQYQLT